MWPLVLMLAFVGGLALAGNAEPGYGPRDVLAPGFSGEPTRVERVKGLSSGRYYDLYSWLETSGKTTYRVAKLVGLTNSWMGYLSDFDTNRQRFFRAHASNDAELAMMKSDFGIT